MTYSDAQNSTDQNYSPLSDSPNYNSFRNNSNLAQVEYFTDRIYPMGRMILDSDKSGEFIIEDIPQLLGADNGSTFIQAGESRSLTDKFVSIYTYQQFHQGIEVVGGGYTIYASPNIGTDPCAKAYALSPNIGTNITVSSNPEINENDISNILGTEDFFGAKLVYHHNLLGKGEYYLVWKGFYNDEGTSKYFYIDAKKGVLLKSGSNREHFSAPTHAYGEQEMDDINNNGTVTLESSDGRIITYDHTSLGVQNDFSNFIDMYIPNTNVNEEWTPLIAPTSVYQTHFAARVALDVFIDLGIDGRLDVMHNSVIDDTRVFNFSPQQVIDNDNNPNVDTDADIFHNYLTFGALADDSPLAVIDIVGHEYAHNYLRNLLSYIDDAPSQSLNEGFADILGIYVESVYQNGVVDWPLGDDDDAVRNWAGSVSAVNRDPSDYNEHNSCFTNVEDETSRIYLRAYPLTRWFYKITEGAHNVPALGIEKSIRIVIDALNVMNNPDADYADFREAVEMTVDLIYGRCSDESTAIRRAFFQICVGSHETCDWTTTIPKSLCIDKVDGLYACAVHGFEDFNYRWYFPSPDWDVAGAGNTNSVTGVCARAMNIPDYPYYPRTVTIRVLNLVTNESKNFDVRLRDCSNSSGGSGCGQASLNESIDELFTSNLQEKPGSMIQVFDIAGRIIYKGTLEGFEQKRYQIDGLYIIAFFDENGTFLTSKKLINQY